MTRDECPICSNPWAAGMWCNARHDEPQPPRRRKRRRRKRRAGASR